MNHDSVLSSAFANSNTNPNTSHMSLNTSNTDENMNASSINKAHDMGNNRYKVHNESNAHTNISGVGMESSGTVELVLKKFAHLEEVVMQENQHLKERISATENICEKLNSTVSFVMCFF